MKKTKNPSVSKLGLRGWMILQNIILVIGSIMAYELVDFFINVVINKDYEYDAIAGIGMLLPMAILVYIVTNAFSKALYYYISELTNGIGKIAKGTFHIKLDENSGGPLQEVYHNFNVMSDELSSIDTLRNDFINEFSHEFKTPLASINGFSNLLLEENCSKEQITQYLTIISKESERLIALTQSQLLLSKLDSQHIVLDKTSYSLDEQIRYCIIMLASQWEEKNIVLSLNLSEIIFLGNAEMTQHIWINLFTNAIKYTPQNGEINVVAEIRHKAIEISISDTGIGMSEEQIEHIFDKYYRIDSSSPIEGLGLGLSIVKRIVELSDGQLIVTSKSGEGSTFTVILPVN